MGLNVLTRLFVHATNVHSGGGLSLLRPLLMAIPADIETTALLDIRMTHIGMLTKKLSIRYVFATILQRVSAEWWLAKHTKQNDIILCFGNLPPLFKLQGHIVVFVQNRYLIDNVSLAGFPLKIRIRLEVERLWFSARIKNIHEFVVQTPTMKRLLDVRTKGKIPVRVLPFMMDPEGYARKIQPPEIKMKEKFNFLYVASGEPHKNHRKLIAAWCLLANEGIFPLLKLTLEKRYFPELCSWLEHNIGQYRLNVENVGSIPHAEVNQLYSQAGALIYPSVFESFGLPLIEARQAGLPVLASELDYVRDVLDPEQSFDPESAVSIARAVKRFLGMDEQELPLLDAGGFVNAILDKAN
ncbi:MAG: glycosyltransferase family 4 protein [Formivibrio sp.]|nr:glycosyltransferase family 4 protein [Formivibrio sp.]